jgi:hypothetical protein
MESRVEECLPAEKRALCLESHSHARPKASHDCIFDIVDISVFLERKDTSIGSGTDRDMNIPRKLKDIIMPR